MDAVSQTASDKALEQLGKDLEDSLAKLEDDIKMHQDKVDHSTKMDAAAKDFSTAATATKAAAEADLKAAQCHEKTLKEMKAKFDICDALTKQEKASPAATTGQTAAPAAK